jgi:hypothetical protein
MSTDRGIYICEYCRLDYKDVQYDEAERMANYDLVCDSCNVNPFINEKKAKYDWTDDEYYESTWSWVDECELEDDEADKE